MNLKKIIFFSKLFFINFFFLEVFSFFCLFFIGEAQWNYEKKLEKTSEMIFSGYDEPERLSHIYGDLFSGNVPHPYFAFMYEGSSYGGENKYYGHDVDVHGFYGDVKFPFEKQSTDFIVGILGGSVSDQFARYILENHDARKRLIAVLKTRYPESKSKNVKLVGLGQGGNKQPQQFFIASYLLKYLDVTINIDGYNEYSDQAPMEYPIEFPSDRRHYSYLNGVDRENYRFHQQVQNIIFLRGMSDLIHFERHIPVLKYSQSYFLFQRFLHTFFAKKISENLHIIREKRDNNRKKTPYFAHLYEKGDIHLKVEVWKRFSLQQYYLFKSYGVQSVFFLQPIPAIPDAKIWSRKEREERHLPSNSGKRRFCELMRSEIRSLREKKLPFYDLTYTFKNVKETVYIDGVHFNNRGLEILFEEILNQLHFNSSTKSHDFLVK